MQRLDVFEYSPNKSPAVVHYTVPFAPAAVSGGTARVMLKAVGFPSFVERAINMGLRALAESSTFCEIFYILLPI